MLAGVQGWMFFRPNKHGYPNFWGCHHVLCRKKKEYDIKPQSVRHYIFNMHQLLRGQIQKKDGLGQN
jgi:hypothetical protein